MKRQYHVISAKNFGYEPILGDNAYDFFFFPTDEFSQSEALGLFQEVTKETLKPNNRWYSYTAYEYRGLSYCGDRFGKQYYKIIYCGITNEDSVPYGN